jgi:PleD family two-component response regulator
MTQQKHHPGRRNQEAQKEVSSMVPRESVAPSDPASSAADDATWDGSSHDGEYIPRILVVDDQLTNVVLLQKILARAGYKRVERITDPGSFRSG